MTAHSSCIGVDNVFSSAQLKPYICEDRFFREWVVIAFLNSRWKFTLKHGIYPRCFRSHHKKMDYETDDTQYSNNTAATECKWWRHTQCILGNDVQITLLYMHLSVLTLYTLDSMGLYTNVNSLIFWIHYCNQNIIRQQNSFSNWGFGFARTVWKWVLS